MTLPQRITQAGRYPVRWDPCPMLTGNYVKLDAPRAAILHTTEGGWAGSERVFKRHWAPTFMVGIDENHEASIVQLIPIGITAAACMAHNNLAIAEVEMIGYSKEQPWLPDPATLDALASLMLAIRDQLGVPLTRPWKDGDYGRAGDNPHRHSGKFGTTAGWFAHADMPPPDNHWDVGNLQWGKIFAHAESLAPVPKAPVTAAPKKSAKKR